MPAACSGFRVWPYADHFLLEPLDGRDGTLKISRKEGEASAGGTPLTTPYAGHELLHANGELPNAILHVSDSQRETSAWKPVGKPRIACSLSSWTFADRISDMAVSDD